MDAVALKALSELAILVALIEGYNKNIEFVTNNNLMDIMDIVEAFGDVLDEVLENKEIQQLEYIYSLDGKE